MQNINLTLIFITLVYSVFFFNIHHKLAEYLNLFDFPSQRKIHKKKVPLTGGLGLITLLFLIFTLEKFRLFSFTSLFHLSIIHDNKFFYFIVLTFLIGFLDDKLTLTPLKKTIMLLFLFLIFVMDVDLLQIKNVSIYNLNLNLNYFNIQIIFTTLCFFIFTNAFNMFDGINLQTTLYSIFFLFNLYLFDNSQFLLIILFYLIVFGIYNNQTKTFLGDSGCNIISSILSVYCIKLYNLELILIEQILILMLFPGLDMIRLFFSRIVEKKNPFVADKKHLHHYIIKSFNYNKMIYFILLILILKSILIFYLPNIFSIMLLTTVYIISFNYAKNRSINV